MKPTIAVIGAGALGTVIAVALHEAGRDVVVCARRPQSALRVDSTSGSNTTLDVPVLTQADGLAPADMVVLTTKAQDTAGAAPWLDRLVGPSTTLVSVQNGITHRERLAGIVAAEQVLPAIAYISAERVAPGHVVHAIGNQLLVPPGRLADCAVAAFQGSSIEVCPRDDFVTVQWRKLLTNIAGNAITALTMRRMNVFELADIRVLAVGLLTEAVAVGRAAGASLGDGEVDEIMAMYQRMPAGSGSSMLYDRLGGRSLEHEYLTGAVVECAAHYDIVVPLNTAVLALLRGLDGSEERT